MLILIHENSSILSESLAFRAFSASDRTLTLLSAEQMKNRSVIYLKEELTMEWRIFIFQCDNVIVYILEFAGTFES